jgi:hypothetical protein
MPENAGKEALTRRGRNAYFNSVWFIIDEIDGTSITGHFQLIDRKTGESILMPKVRLLKGHIASLDGIYVKVHSKIEYNG